jgi:hypothetical protein
MYSWLVVRAVIVSGVLVMMTASSFAEPARDLEIGADVGGDSTGEFTMGPCPILARAPATPANECWSAPHGGQQGVVAGGHVRYHVWPSLSVEAGLTYAQKGYDDGVAVRLHYVEAPVLVRFDPAANTSPARVFVIGGISPAVLAACHTSGEIFINDPPPHPEMYSGSCAGVPGNDVTPNRFDLSGILGLGVGWRFDFGLITIQARWVRGLVDVDGYQQSGKTVNDSTYVLAGFDTRL